MKIIGLTGGIGSGKTTVARYLTEKGYPIIDADQVARDIVQPGWKALKDIERTFGKGVIRLDGGLDREKLGELVFSDNEKLKLLNSIMHKEILAVINLEIQALMDQHVALVFVDAALLFETGLDKIVEETWVMDAPESMRIDRIKNRDELSDCQIKARISSQMAQEEKNKRATVVIDNSLGLEELYKKIEQLIKNHEA